MTIRRFILCLTIFGVLGGVSPYSASTHAGGLSNAIVYDVPQELSKMQFDKSVSSELSRADSIAISAYRFVGDTVKVLVILVDWGDRPHTYSRTSLDSLFFSRNVYPGGSVADYFAEVSYGQIEMVGDVLDWHEAGGVYPGPSFEALFPILDLVVDYSQYDGNHDGIVDVLIFVRSGNGQEDSADPNDIWSYAVSRSPAGAAGPYDGVKIQHWCTSPETRPIRNPSNPTLFLGLDVLNRIEVACHEICHNLGLPDLYDRDSKLDTTTYTIPNDLNDHLNRPGFTGELFS